MAAGFEESYIRIWSLKGESLNVLKSDFDVNKIKDSKSRSFNNFVFIDPLTSSITQSFSIFYPQNSRKRRTFNTETNRPQRTCLLAGIRPHRRFLRPAKIPPLRLSRFYRPTMVSGHHDECCCLSGASESRVGCGLE